MIIAGNLGTAGEAEHCLETARRRCQVTLARPDQRIEYWRVDAPDWDAGSAALVLDDFVRRPSSFLTTLLSSAD